MYLDNHSLLSVMSGLVENYNGAANYFNDRLNPLQASRTIYCRVQSQEKHLDLEALLDRTLTKRFHGNPEMFECMVPDATHVVVGVIYGSQAYCSLSNNLNVDKLVGGAREAAEDKLYKIATKMLKALKSDQNLTQFREQFDQDERELSARLYADLQVETSRECDIYSVYKHLRKMMTETSEAVPIVVLLCPLKDIEVLAGDFPDIYEYHDVGVKVVARLGRALSELDRVVAKVDAIYATAVRDNRPSLSSSLKQFKDSIDKYQQVLVKKSLKEEVVKSRKKETEDEEIDDDDSEAGDYDVLEIVDAIEYHGYFKPSRLERWLRDKLAEMEVDKKMSGVDGVTFLASKDQLDGMVKKTATVLTVPPLSEVTKRIVDGMTEYVDKYTSLLPIDAVFGDDSSAENVGNPWHNALCKRKKALAKIEEFANHVAKKKQKDEGQFFIVVDDDCEDASYSI